MLIKVRNCDLRSAQRNEAFNDSVAVKAPKCHFYGGSDSLNFSVAATSAQWNMARSAYVMKVYVLSFFRGYLRLIAEVIITSMSEDISS